MTKVSAWDLLGSNPNFEKAEVQIDLPSPIELLKDLDQMAAETLWFDRTIDEYLRDTGGPDRLILAAMDATKSTDKGEPSLQVVWWQTDTSPKGTYYICRHWYEPEGFERSQISGLFSRYDEAVLVAAYDSAKGW